MNAGSADRPEPVLRPAGPHEVRRARQQITAPRAKARRFRYSLLTTLWTIHGFSIPNSRLTAKFYVARSFRVPFLSLSGVSSVSIVGSDFCVFSHSVIGTFRVFRGYLFLKHNASGIRERTNHEPLEIHETHKGSLLLRSLKSSTADIARTIS